MSELFNQIALVVVGWLLGFLSQGIERRRQESLERRRVLTRLDRILMTVAIELTIKKELSANRDLPEPPMLPEDFDRVVDQLGDWEARRGESTIHFQLITLKRLVELAREGYATLEGEGDVPASLSSVYERELKEVGDMTWRLINRVQGAQLGLIGRIRERLRPKLSEGLGSRPTQEELAQPGAPNPPADQKAPLPDR